MTLDDLIHQLKQIRSVAARAGETETYVTRVTLDDDGHVVVTKRSDEPRRSGHTAKHARRATPKHESE